jgi:phosphoglucomutase
MDLFKRVGREYWPVRENLHLSGEAQSKLPERLKSEFKEFLGKKVAKENRLDGLKLIFEDGSWVLMRPSGTEPVVRIYTEAATQAASEKLAKEASAWISQ